MKSVCILAILLVSLPVSVAGTTDGPERPVVQQDDEQVCLTLEAPTKGKVGELIRFTLTSEADSIKWLAPTEDFQTFDNGRQAVFSARTQGTYTFIVAVALEGTVDVSRHTLVITGPPERPTTDDLALWIPFWAETMNLPKEEALTLAASFEDVASRITAISTPKGIIEATAEANRTALGPSLAAWRPMLVKIQTALGKRSQTGLLSTPEQHTATWREIAAGLRKLAE
jgi:hypothetical protein